MLKRFLLAPLAGLFLLGGCVPVPTLVAAAGIVTTAAQVIDTGVRATQAWQAARGRVASTPGLGLKFVTLRREYCARPELRAAARTDIEALALAGGIPDDHAAAQAGLLKAFGDRICEGTP